MQDKKFNHTTGIDYYYLSLLSFFIVRFRNAILLSVISLYLILNYGFMLVRIPPVGHVAFPIGELVLLFFLVTTDNIKSLTRLSSTLFLVPFIVWWALGLGRAFAAIPEYGFWALRDATHVIESLFLIVGFVFAANPRNLESFFRLLPKLLIVGCIYGLTYPFADTLRALSPQLVAVAGHRVPLFFNYHNTPLVLLMASAYFMIFEHRKWASNVTLFIVAFFLLGYTILIFQYRTIYLQVIAVFLLFALSRRRLFWKGVLSIFLLFLSLLVVSMVDFQLIGRLGKDVSVDFLINHFLSIGGVKSESLGAIANALDLRLGWWLNLYNRWTSDIYTTLFGMGYGFPLIDFIAKGVIVREPHNSYISILARIGLVGAVSFVWMHLLLIGIWRSGYKHCVRARWQEGQNRLLILMVFFVLVWILAIGEDVFEKPYLIIPYYFFWGIILRFVNHFKKADCTNLSATSTLCEDRR